MAGETLLLVDDDATLLRFLTEYLEREGYSVHSAERGQAALRRFYESRPDILVLDVMMPGMDGWEVCARLRELADTPVILLTAKTSEADKLRGFRLGVDDYITKPFSLAELGARLVLQLALVVPGAVEAIVRVVGEEQFEGGVHAASLHAEWKGADYVISCPAVTKTRFVDADFNPKLLDVYSATRSFIPEPQREWIRQQFAKMVKEYDVVVVFDFGHGLIGSAEQDFLYGAKFLAVNAQTNAGNYGYNLITRYSVADFICVDDQEARLAAQMPTEQIEQVVNHGLAPHIACNRYLVTHGRHGSYYRDLRLRGDAPAFSLGGIDTMGAGDAVMAVTAPLVPLDSR